MLECVVNISEGRDQEILGTLREAVAGALLDVHSDTHHNRSVFTLVGTEAVRTLATEAVRLIDLRIHSGVHPRIGVVDVVPFVALGTTDPNQAIKARNDYAAWSANNLAVPTFLYGPERTLPAIRKEAFRTLQPDFGASEPHPSAGATAVGARPALVAYNLWLATADLAEARRIAAVIRGPQLRTLGLQVGDEVQVSMNLIDPTVVGPKDVYEMVSQYAPVGRAELVGLIPAEVLLAIAETWWSRLDLSAEATIEARIEALG